MKNKVIALIASVALLITMTLPGTLAISSDEEIIGSGATADTEMQEQETEDVQQPDEEQEAQEPPAAEEEPTVNEENPTTCTCNPAPAAGEAHREGCPLSAASEKSVSSAHIKTCFDGCTANECACVCHLFNRIMACTTLDGIWEIMDHMTEEQWEILSDSQMDAIDQLIARLDAEQFSVQPEEDHNPQIESEIIYPTTNYTYVAPFKEPVTGKNK